VALATVYAAGVLCWRETAEGIKVLLVRRPDYGDVSVPKGKLDPGELLPETAIRELLEETGVVATLGAPIGNVSYTAGGRPKFVQYWAAEVLGHQVETAKFTPNDEISAVDWVPIAAAKKLVSYAHDRAMVTTLADRIKRGAARSFSITILRHGKSIPPGDWDGPDATRPLLHRGLDQAMTAAPSIAAFGPTRLISSSATRCLTTIEPTSRVTGLPVKIQPGISQDAYADGTSRAAEQITKRLRRKQNVVLCTHGPIIPELVEAIRHGSSAHRAGLERASNLAPGEFAVFHLTSESAKPYLVEVEVHGAG
jgi:8-oxo-dGTP diphosphatase